MPLPAQSPYLVVEIDGDDTVIRWKNTTTPGPSIKIKSKVNSQTDPLLEIENFDDRVHMRLRVGADWFDIRNDDGRLKVVSSAGDTVLSLDTSRPSITGSRGGNVALTNLLLALEDMRLLDDSTSA